MSASRDQSQWTAGQTLQYVLGLVAADDNKDNKEHMQTLYTALSISYEYLITSIKRKITWSLSLQKLAHEFIDLAFATNMHSSIKDVFKAYRSLTQGQYSESLKYVLEHYRDKKLEAILRTQIPPQDLPLIIGLSNIESEEMSSDLILSSFNPELKQRRISIKQKLRIVWQGYKSIVETVRVNQKLEDVYMDTLRKIFDFVDQYNRKHEFKTFCKTLRSGLQNAFNKRDKTEQQKAIYIDIEKKEVNDRNISIRMHQFKVATKLGLWQQAFQVLEDINNLMRVRRAPIKNIVKCEYFENLGLLFRKSNYWHYHAYAAYNHYQASISNPNLSQEEKRVLADKLLLSALCIPPVTLQSHQSKQSQEKICSMMISSTKIPDKAQLFEMMISKGIVENSSEEIKQLWNFMFMEFNLSSLNKGLDLLRRISDTYSQFQKLIENILVYRQLISIAEVYQRIKMSSLLKLIPLAKDKVEKILIECHRSKIIDFSLDESQGIVVFEDRAQQINPCDQLHDIFLQVAIAREKEHRLDSQFIRRKTAIFVNDAEQYFWKIRQLKIEQYRRKLKQPKQELKDKEQQKLRKQKQQRQLLEQERKLQQQEALKRIQQAKIALARKKIVVKQIIAAKQNKTVRILDKKIENLTDEEIENITMDTLQEHLKETQKNIATIKEAKFNKMFTHVDYIERMRRELLVEKFKGMIPTQESEQARADQVNKISLRDLEERKEQRDKLMQIATYLKSKIEDQVKIVNDRYDSELKEFKKRMINNFKGVILQKAKDLEKENEAKKLAALSRTDQQDRMDFEGPWIRKSMTAGAAEKEAAKLEITKGKNVGKKEEQPSNWQTGAFIKKINPMEGIEGRTEDKGEKWIIGKPRAPDTEVVPTTKQYKNDQNWKTKDSSSFEGSGTTQTLSFGTKLAASDEKGWTMKQKTSQTAQKKQETPLVRKFVDVNEQQPKKFADVNAGLKKQQPPQKGRKLI